MVNNPATQHVPVEELAAAYGITLPSVDQLPPSYTSLRMWLNRRIATLSGKHKQVWQTTKQDPDKLARVREANKHRVHAYRERCQQQQQAASA
jgi:hypothetical protein